MDPITANYLMDYLFFSRDDELFRYYKKVRRGRNLLTFYPKIILFLSTNNKHFEDIC